MVKRRAFSTMTPDSLAKQILFTVQPSQSSQGAVEAVQSISISASAAAAAPAPTPPWDRRTGGGGRNRTTADAEQSPARHGSRHLGSIRSRSTHTWPSSQSRTGPRLGRRAGVLGGPPPTAALACETSVTVLRSPPASAASRMQRTP